MITVYCEKYGNINTIWEKMRNIRNVK